MGKKLKFQSPADVAPKKATVVLYGPAGSGKSTFASTFPGPYYLVPAISANEMKTLDGLGLEENILVFSDMMGMYHTVQELARMIRAGELPDCHTIIFDNLTSAQLMAEQELLEKTGKKKLEWEEWSEFTTLWKNLMAYLHSLPANMIWITHAETREVRPKEHGVQPYTVGDPTLVGKSRRFIPSYADMFLYCDVIDRGIGLPIEFYVYLKQSGIWTSRIRGNKERIKKLPAYLGGTTPKGKPIDPHYDTLAKLMGWPSQQEVEEGGVEYEDTAEEAKS